MKTYTYKTRFCPSPTGLMHLGNVRTALFNKLLALSSPGGCFLLRLEDTDQDRSTVEYINDLKNDLRWLGLNWDEGPDQEAAAGPYEQSNRQSIYNTYYALLEEQGIAYPCFCSQDTLALSRKRLLARGVPPRYEGTCRRLTPAEVSAKQAQGIQPVLRFCVPDKGHCVFTDFVKGEQRAAYNTLGDFVIRRGDGSPTFLFCNALDDALMGVTHVLRGEDHLANTFRQQMLLEALDLRCPHYGHMALILGEDGAPLSKRNGSQSIASLREQGFIPLALINYLARLGHRIQDETLLSLNALASQYRIEHLSLAPARFDKHQLNHWQKLAILSLDDNALWGWMGPMVHTRVDRVATQEREAFVQLVRDNLLFPQDAEHWAKAFYDQSPLYQRGEQPIYDIIANAGASFFESAYTLLKHQPTLSYSAWITALQDITGQKGKALFMPLRVAMTGQTGGPSLNAVFDLLARDDLHWAALRMHQAIDCLLTQ